MQRVAKLKPAGRSQFNVEHSQRDPVHLCVFDRLRRPDKARDRGVRHDLSQNIQTVGEYDLVVVHHDDIRNFIALRRKVKKPAGVDIEAFGNAGNHRGVRQTISSFPSCNGGMIDKQLFPELLLRKSFFCSQLPQSLSKQHIHAIHPLYYMFIIIQSGSKKQAESIILICQSGKLS